MQQIKTQLTAPKEGKKSRRPRDREMEAEGKIRDLSKSKT